jgi:serine protease inhibitor ecotin
VNSQVPSKVFCGEGPQLAWGEESAKPAEEFAPPPQGESALDASMMAELIVTKKGDRASAHKVRRNLAGQTEKPQRRRSTIAVGGKTWGRAIDSLVPGFGGGLGGGVRCLSFDAS